MGAEVSAVPVVELRSVNQTYDCGKSYVIKDFDLTIDDVPDRGQFVVLLGPSGCGKSTVLRYISGLQEPTSGEIFMKGKKVDGHGHVPMVFQTYSNFGWLTVRDNVAVSLRYKGLNPKNEKDKIDRIVGLVGLKDHVDKYAQDTILSGGQLQRVAIARSLISDPETLLMDEPFGALDIRTRLSMQLLLTSVWYAMSNMTIIMVTHDISEAVFLADYIYIMSPMPSKIVKGYRVELPFPRVKELKRTREYIETVEMLEDAMYTTAEGR
jgi:NitT/TauT family transport system ATP-binding protein